LQSVSFFLILKNSKDLQPRRQICGYHSQSPFYGAPDRWLFQSLAKERAEFIDNDRTATDISNEPGLVFVAQRAVAPVAHVVVLVSFDPVSERELGIMLATKNA
jgi:hypothetical protein